MSEIQNEPISYDDHGNIPFRVPFRELSPRDISLYLQLNTKVGKSTCRQACSHCFFINQPEARGRSMDLREGRRVMDDLVELGYQVFPMISDSFAAGGEFLRTFGNTHNRNFRQGQECSPTKTMAKGQMWTSGAPLLDAGWEELLCVGIENGFGSVAITFHGLLDEALELRSPDTYPIRGVLHGRDCEEVIARIQSFNAALERNGISRLRFLPESLRLPLEINIGLTLTSLNHRREDLLRYTAYFNRRGVSVVRFNCFHDHGWRHPELTLSRKQIAGVYRDLKWIHTHVPLRFQLGVDEDFGTSGIEVMGFPSHTGWCRAGRQLFAIVPEPLEVLELANQGWTERAGTIAACVDAFKPIVGHLVRNTERATGFVSYRLDFLHEVIDELNRKRMSGIYKDGCFATEMLAELKPARPSGPKYRMPVLHASTG